MDRVGPPAGQSPASAWVPPRRHKVVGSIQGLEQTLGPIVDRLVISARRQPATIPPATKEAFALLGFVPQLALNASGSFARSALHSCAAFFAFEEACAESFARQASEAALGLPFGA